jgi:DNA-binding MarR family transcriptional regulator
MKETFQLVEGLRDTLAFPVEIACRVVSRRAEIWLQRVAGCEPRELWVLLCVDSMKLNQKQISSALFLHPTTVVQLIDKLEKRKLVKRTSPKGNRRQNVIELTDKGREVVESAVSRRREAVRELFAPLAEADAAQFRDWSLAIAMSQKAPIHLDA